MRQVVVDAVDRPVRDFVEARVRARVAPDVVSRAAHATYEEFKGLIRKPARIGPRAPDSGRPFLLADGDACRRRQRRTRMT
jgi:hypothetical protein